MTMISMNSSQIGTIMDSVEVAAQQVDFSLRADSKYEDLSGLLQIPRHNAPSESGRQELDYPCLSDSRIGLTSVSELANIRKVPLPVELVEQFGHMQCNCMMGLFPEIARAWLSIDSDIFVWNYEDGSDLAYFDGLSETILSAGLVRPKAGIFQPHIQYLLCLTTPVDIVLLGVSFAKPFEAHSEGGLGEMHLLPEPLFSIPTDNVHILKVTGTRDGRVFMAGKDGCLYELLYQAEDGWFSRKCRKVNHSTSKLSYVLPSFLNFSFIDDDAIIQISIDDSRHILYTKSEKGTIQVYDLGSDGKGMGRVAAISQQTSQQNAALVAKTIDKSNFSKIVYIAAVSRTESVNIHLVAVTQTGVRLYYTTNAFGENRGRPCMLTLVHVRLPPGFSGPHSTAAPQKPANVHCAHYRKGTLLLACAQDEDSDILWAVGPDSFPFHSQLMETFETHHIDGRSWAMAEVPSHSLKAVDEDPGPLEKADPPLVVTQHMEPIRRFVLLNSQGSYLMSKLHPVDQLRQLLLRFGPDAEEVKAFFKLHREDQACATCLILACSNMNQVEQEVSQYAIRAFFLHGGEAEYVPAGAMTGPSAATLGPNISTTTPANLSTSFAAQPTSPIAASAGLGHGAYTSFTTPGPGMHPNQMSTPYPHFGQTQQSMQQTVGHGYNQDRNVQYSGKHDGLCLYLGRILRPLWELRMVADVPVKGSQAQKQYLASRLRSDELSWYLEQLLALRDFMQTNSHFSSPLMAESYAAAQSVRTRIGRMDDGLDEQTRRKLTVEAQTAEKSSLQQLEQLITRACEGLGLWRILCDHQFHAVTSMLSQEHQNILRTINYRTFVTIGKEMASALITCLINRYINDNAAIDAISVKLREVCPSLYSSEDAICSKANEMLQSAKTTQEQLDRRNQLNEALRHYKEIAIDLDIPTVCSQFSAVRYYTGIVDLAQTAASKRDPQGLGLHYYRSGEPAEDTQGRQAYLNRMDCYRCILETLRYLMFTSQSHPQAPSVPHTPGPPPARDPTQLTNAEAAQHMEQTFVLCLKSDDELFHIALYQWLIQESLHEKLLEIQSPFLEPYLNRCFHIQPDNIPVLDLLWRYYEKVHSFSAAARILARLAERHGTDITLEQRMEYLSRASMNAKSSTMRTAPSADGEFLHELEEKLEVARIQLKVFEALRRLPANTPGVSECLGRLNAELVDITTLYGDFADVFQLSECKLAIIHCAGHFDPTLVETLWRDVIDNELDTTMNLPADTRMTTLRNKLVSLGQTYRGTDRYFPLEFLILYLERKSCELNLDPTLVFTIMRDVGISVPKLHEIYDRLFRSKDPCWQNLRKPFHLLHVIQLLLETFAINPTIIQAYERRQFTTTCLDSVANYLVELHATSANHPLINQLRTNYKALQAKLERLH